MIKRKSFRSIAVFRVLYGNITAQYADFVYYAESFLHNTIIYVIINRITAILPPLEYR